MSESSSGWPAHAVERRPWRQAVRGGGRADRTLDHVDASVPPRIAMLDPSLPRDLVALLERAVIEIAATDAEARGQSRALGRFMLRTESVASSKIERIAASTEDYARALAGSRANSSAISMVAASGALHRLIEQAGSSDAITLDDLLEAHRALMKDDPAESDLAGRFRDMQNWIGGSDHSPLGALYVPPPPELIGALMADLMEWFGRDDVPVLVQAAIGHAQFESIHPFTDGNGRIGRALISASLRHRGLTRNVVMPVASGILAVREAYFDALTAYRRGEPERIVEILAQSARIAAVEARASLDDLRALPAEWRRVARPHAGSAADALIDAFFDDPVMSAEEILAATGGSAAAAYAAIDRLVEAEVVREITGRKRDRVWAADDALGELDALDLRIRRAMEVAWRG